MSFRDARSVGELAKKLGSAKPKDLRDLRLMLDGAHADMARAASELAIAERIYKVIEKRIRELEKQKKKKRKKKKK